MATETDLKRLYQDVILRHNRQPVGFERVEDAPVELPAYNPLCGDSFTLFLEWEAGRVGRARFFGYGCAISKASASVLVTLVEGLDKPALKRLLRQVRCVVDPGCPLPAELAEDLRAFAAARDFPARQSCVTLVWDALSRHLEAED